MERVAWRFADRAATGSGVLWAWPFRPFFLGAGVLGALLVPAWLILLLGWAEPSTALPVLHWHIHEMFFGLLGAALAGFLLTAVCHWTGTGPVAGARLAALFVLWVSGRVLLAAGGELPFLLVSFVDLAFLPLVALAAGMRVAKSGQWHNMMVPVAVIGLWAADLMFHLYPREGLPRTGVELAAGAAALMMIIVGGRITPAFTRNWLRREGGPWQRVAATPGLDRAMVAAAVAMVLADAAGISAAAAAFAGLAAVAGAARLVAWRGWLARGEALLWILHLGMLWVVLALSLRAVGWWFSLAPTLWLHALGAGAMGTLILGVMTRVALGHTGRPLRLPRGAVTIYASISLAAVLRVATAAGMLDYWQGIWGAGLAWTLAFLLFLWWYAPILFSERADGRAG